ncbi:MAG: dihydrofolate reductase family protein [Pirellulales bacterium]|nr:dihydrofolate reductase family protein [Pirellulales bacterium]
MKRVCYSVAASLDGFIAGPQGEYDWIPEAPEIDFQPLVERFDTFILGSGTYATVLGQGEEGFTVFTGKQVLVFSDSLEQADHPKVNIVKSRDLTATLQDLRKQSGKDVWLFGGGQLFRSLAEAGFVDSVEVAVMPILLGDGIPLLPTPAPRIKLQLNSHRFYEPSGVVVLEYDVVSGE